MIIANGITFAPDGGGAGRWLTPPITCSGRSTTTRPPVLPPTAACCCSTDPPAVARTAPAWMPGNVYVAIMAGGRVEKVSPRVSCSP